jgi:hypothetical protein
MSSMTETFQMYNAFAKRSVMLTMQRSAYDRIITLYEEGWTTAIAIVIAAYRQAVTDNRYDMLQIIPVAVALSGIEREFIVLCGVYMVSDNDKNINEHQQIPPVIAFKVPMIPMALS